jgi:hypothetical protein
MLDLSALITDSNFCETCTLVRTRIERTKDGRERKSADTLTITAVVQPSTDAEITALSELTAGRLTEMLTIYTTQPLLTADDSHLADTVMYKGSTYDVVQVRNYFFNGGYCQAFIARVAHNDRLD